MHLAFISRQVELSCRRRLGSLLLWACVQCVTSIDPAQLLPIVSVLINYMMCQTCSHPTATRRVQAGEAVVWHSSPTRGQSGKG